MKDIVEYLDRIGHKLGIGGFEGVIGAFVLSMAALVIISQYFSLLWGTGIRKKQPKIQRDSHIRNGVKTPKRQSGGMMDLRPSVQS